MKVFNINDSYFKYQKCFSGITYQYVNQLNNIYEKNLMVGTNYCTYCMYNEFDIINNFMVNLYQIDICSTINLDLNSRYYKIDNAYIRTGHKVLLVNQTDPKENDIYRVDSKGQLILTDDLSTPTKAWRYKAYIKLGDNKSKQFHLINSGNRFPLTGERKYFLDGHGYIIKNLFNYDINATDSISRKIVFADYELARISVNQNYDLYSGFILPTGITSFDISYHGGEYLITIDSDTTKFITTGITSGSTIYNWNDVNDNGFGYQTYITVSPTFLSNVDVYDYVKLEISGSTNLTLQTFIKKTGATYVVLADYIPDYVLYNFNSIFTGSTYTFTNLQFSTTADFNNTLLDSFYAKYFNLSTNTETSEVTLIPINNPVNSYFDYDGLIFNVTSSTATNSFSFTTDNDYIKYKLYEQLNNINSSVFTQIYNFFTPFELYYTGFTLEYRDNRPDTITYPGTYGDQKGTWVKIIPSTKSDVNRFKKNTFVELSVSGDTYKTLVVDLMPNEYFTIETYKSNSALTESSFNIKTIYDLETISNILYDVFLNDETPICEDYYRIKDDDMRRNIFNAYADFISQDINVINYSTAFLMQDNEHKFILKIYDPENTLNGGTLRPPTIVSILDNIPTSTGATLSGQIIEDGGSPITERGIQYSDIKTNLNLSVISPFTTGTTYDKYDCNIINLQSDKIYYYRAYAKNEQTIGYGEIYSFSTLTL